MLFYESNVYVQCLRDEGVNVLTYDAVRERERNARTSGRFRDKLLDVVRAMLRRRACLQQHGVDLVHINNSPHVGFDDWLPACRLNGIPIVSSVRSDASGSETAWEGLFFRHFDMVIPVSQWIGRDMHRHGIAAARIRTVYTGIDTDGFRERIRRERGQIRSELGIGSDDLFGVMVGNIRAWKGQHVVLEAAAAARREGAELQIAFVGDTGRSVGHQAYERTILEQADCQELRGAVHFLGARVDVPDLFAAADVAIHSSVEPEPFGLVIVEAMATGTPVIASRNGGPA